MSSNSIYQFKPTYLYVKRHSITGKLYFGKTVTDPEKYLGSGKYWKAHIKKHGVEHVETLWYCLFLDQESITEFALNFSKQQNIVESDEWANMAIENGIDGQIPGFKMSDEAKSKISEATRGSNNPMFGVVRSSESRRKMSENRRGKLVSDEWRKNHSAKLKGRKVRTIVCPHCGKEGGISQIKRWHFDNCKAVTSSL